MSHYTLRLNSHFDDDDDLCERGKIELIAFDD